jgi:hypothetical protein
MKLESNQAKCETHPNLPSGEWEGFYCYNHTPEQHKMASELSFINTSVKGSGTDDVSPFRWTGTYSLEDFKTSLSKIYSTHTVFYKGNIDENGIWGTWEMRYDFSQFSPLMIAAIKETYKNDMIGGFHIWPKKGNSESLHNALCEVNESPKLKEIFVKEFS